MPYSSAEVAIVLRLIEERLAAAGCPHPKSAAVRELRAMAGCVITYPAGADVDRFLADRSIAKALRKNPSLGNAARLARNHGDARRVAKAFRTHMHRGLAQARKDAAVAR